MKCRDLVRKIFDNIILDLKKEYKLIQKYEIKLSRLNIDYARTNYDTEVDKDNFTIFYVIHLPTTTYIITVRVINGNVTITDKKVKRYRTKNLQIIASLHDYLLSKDEIDKKVEEVLQSVQGIDKDLFLGKINEKFNNEGITDIETETIKKYKTTFVIIRSPLGEMTIYTTDFFCGSQDMLSPVFIWLYIAMHNDYSSVPRAMALSYIDSNEIKHNYETVTFLEELFNKYINNEMSKEDVEAEIEMAKLQGIF